jgi:hypothetical protein
VNTFGRWGKILFPRTPRVHPCTVPMPNDPKEDEIPLVTWCDLLEKELKSALDDLAEIRKAKSPSEKRNIGIMLRAALGNARHYLSELVDSLKETPTSRGCLSHRSLGVPGVSWNLAGPFRCWAKAARDRGQAIPGNLSQVFKFFRRDRPLHGGSVILTPCPKLFAGC